MPKYKNKTADQLDGQAGSCKLSGANQYRWPTLNQPNRKLLSVLVYSSYWIALILKNVSSVSWSGPTPKVSDSGRRRGPYRLRGLGISSNETHELLE